MSKQTCNQHVNNNVEVNLLKTCSKCGKPEGEVTFSIEKTRSGKLLARSDCKDCRSRYTKRYQQDNLEYFKSKSKTRRREKKILIREAASKSRQLRYALIKEIKESNPCTDCGRYYPYFVMDFDHRDPSTKLVGVATISKRLVRWERVLDEISKCDLVCTRCHRFRTYKGQTCYKTRRFEQHKLVLDELKSTTPCLDCGGKFAPCQMDFDHTHNKYSNIARLVASPSDRVLGELEKCHLVCANCHRVRTNTGVRPVAPEHSTLLVRLFESILSRTDLPSDSRFAPFPLSHLLGVIPDKELAVKTGMSRSMVCWHRRKAGIRLTLKGEVDSTPPLVTPKTPAPKPWHTLAGKITDREVAARFGITSVSVTNYRKKVGIPSFASSRGYR